MDGQLDAVLTLLTKAGPWACFLLTLWWLRQERTERIESQNRERELTNKLLLSVTKTTNAIRSLRYVLIQGKAPDPHEYEAEDVELG